MFSALDKNTARDLPVQNRLLDESETGMWHCDASVILIHVQSHLDVFEDLSASVDMGIS